MHLQHLFVGWLGIGTVVAGTGRGQLEGLDGEGQVLIIGVIDEEPVVDGLLQALGFIALWDQRTAGTSSGALLNPGSLGKGFVVGLDLVNHDPPFAIDVDGPLGLDILGV